MPEDVPTPTRDLRSVAQLLRQRALERPQQKAFAFLTDGSDPLARGEVAWSYAELDRRARAVAGAVARQANPGDRAALVFSPGLDFLAAFFGCLYAGVLPAPATYPKPRRASPRLDGIVADCTPKLALTSADTLATLQLDDQSPAVRDLVWLAVDECPEADVTAGPIDRSPADPAFLQYTSGSTSQPRGVIVTHGNLLHNLELIRAEFDIPPVDSGGPPTVGAFWLPAYHDMGLIGGILTPLYVGGTTYLMAPAMFLQRPASWLEVLSRTGATISGAPNFAYQLCARKISTEQRSTLDLSRWRLAFCGAEPIDPAALEEFAAAMEPRGFRRKAYFPCYGLAEATLMVSGGSGPEGMRVLSADRSQLAANRLVEAGAGAVNSQRLVSCGRPLGDQDVRIVDPQSFEPCEEGSVGEIWIRGKSVAAGYWNHPEELWQTFGGRLADGRGPYLRTGDLGAFRRGELFITGRAKDLIIVRGRNLYPQDVERTAQEAHAAVDMGAAFSVSKDGQEQLVVVHQVRREHRRDDMAPVIRRIRAAVVEQHEIDPLAIVLLRPGGLPLTSSGKVQRNRCREMFERSDLEELARWSQPVENASATTSPLLEIATAANGAPPASIASGPQRPAFLDSLARYTPEGLAAEIQAWMLAWLAERVDVGEAELTPGASFSELGMDSLTALELNVEFETVLGIRLPPAAAWSYPTPAALSQYLAETMLGVASLGGPEGNPIDSWFESMEADARRP